MRHNMIYEAMNICGGKWLSLRPRVVVLGAQGGPLVKFTGALNGAQPPLNFKFLQMSLFCVLYS